jgi:hypothetical protein
LGKVEALAEGERLLVGGEVRAGIVREGLKGTVSGAGVLSVG